MSTERSSRMDLLLNFLFILLVFNFAAWKMFVLQEIFWYRYSRLLVPSTVGRVMWNKMSLLVCLHRVKKTSKLKFNKTSMSHVQRPTKDRWVMTIGQKNIDYFRVQRSKKHFYDFLLSRALSKKHGLGRDQKSKKIGFLTVHWSTSHWFLVGPKVRKTLFTFGFYVR